MKCQDADTFAQNMRKKKKGKICYTFCSCKKKVIASYYKTFYVLKYALKIFGRSVTEGPLLNVGVCRKAFNPPSLRPDTI